MTIKKIIMAGVLGSLTGATVWNGMQGLFESDDRPDSPEDANKTDRQPKKAATGTIAKPETLAKLPTQPTAKPTAPSDTNPFNSQLSVSPQPLANRLPKLPDYTISPPETILPTQALIDQPEPIIPTDQNLRDIEGHWAQYYIESLMTKRIVQGFPDGSFRPNQSITRAEFNTLIQKAFPTGAKVSYANWRSRLADGAATRAQAAAFIYRELARTEAAPIVTSIRVSGAVARPGAYSLAAMSNEYLEQKDKLPTLSRAIQQAGGSLATANLQQVQIRRTTETGATKIIKVNVGRSSSADDIPLEAVLQQDDEVIIPAIAPTAQTNSSEPHTLSSEP